MGCEFDSNADAGVWVQKGGDPRILGCYIHDHRVGEAIGLLVLPSARGGASVGADCVFARNAGGDVVRD